MQEQTLNAAFLSITAVFALASPLEAFAEEEMAALLVNTQSGTIVCDGRDVNVTSSNATLSFTGRCKGLYFVGSHTTATVESATLIQAAGTNLKLTVGGKADEVYLIGGKGQFTFDSVGQLNLNADDARIEAKSIATISALGSRNTVQWSSGAPTINDIGSGNVLKPKP